MPAGNVDITSSADALPLAGATFINWGARDGVIQVGEWGTIVLDGIVSTNVANPKAWMERTKPELYFVNLALLPSVLYKVDSQVR